MARKRRRWVIPAGVFAILAMILGWQGWVLFPSLQGEGDGSAEARVPPIPEDTVPEGSEIEEPAELTEEVVAAPTEEVNQEESVDPGTGDGQTAGDRTGDRGTGDSGTGAGESGRITGAETTGTGDEGAAAIETPVAVETETGEAGETGLDQDRMDALGELIRESVTTGRLGDGFTALQDLEGMAPATQTETQVGRWRIVRTEGRQALGNALTHQVLRLKESLAQGRVLEARNVLSALSGTPHPRVTQALDTMATGEGWPPLGSGPPASANIPRPRDLEAERLVLLESGDQLVAAHVANMEGDQVTLRQRQGNGVVFPTVPRTSLEPVGASGDEALDQGFAALRAGNPQLAWLWACRAHAVGGASAERARELGRLLGGG